MAGSFLRLEPDDLGIKASIVELSYKQALIKDDYYILFRDLLDLKENQDPFDAGMDMVARHLDLKSISTAIIFVSPLFVSFRNLDLPFHSEKKVKQVMSFELETLLPNTDKDYISDFHMLDISGEFNMVLSASIPEMILDRYFTKLGSLGIKPLIVTPGGYAAAVGFLKERKDISTFAFMYIANSGITLVLVKERKPCAVRFFSASITSQKDIALLVKQSIIGFNQRTGVNICFDIFVCIDKDNFESNDMVAALDKTMAYQSGLSLAAQGAQKTLRLEKINGDSLLLHFVPEKPVKYLFNFCQGKYGTTSFLNRYFSSIAACAGLFLCTFCLLMLNLNFDNSTLEKQIAAIDNKAFSIFKSTFPDKKKVPDPYLQMQANVQAAVRKSGAVRNEAQLVQNKEIKIVDVLAEISQKIAASTDIEIAMFLFKTGRLVLSGSTDNFNSVDNIKSKIESSQMFTKVSINSAVLNKTGNRINFKFIIEI